MNFRGGATVNAEQRKIAAEKAKARRAFMRTVRILADEPGQLQEAWRLYRGARLIPHVVSFVEIVNSHLNSRKGYDEDQVGVCVPCQRPVWLEESYSDTDGDLVCSDCRTDYATCHGCDEFSIARRWITWVSGYAYCDNCRNENCSFCEDCNEWYLDSRSEEHDHSPDYCECSPHDLRFKVLANSHGSIEQDERLLVELPAGAITEQAITAAINVIWSEQMSPLHDQYIQDRYRDYANAKQPENYADYDKLQRIFDALEPEWQTKRGNFTRRLSSALHKEGIKLNEGLLSKVGSTMRAHTSMRNSWHVEFTRDLNQHPEAFANEGSCWWGSENDGLCAFKHWGGVAMRSYDSADQARQFPSGRAWVQPLNEHLMPTLDAYGAHAFVVYNGYGDLEGYTPARLMAYLTSRTYKKIGFEASYQYINAGGYLVADQETCDKTTSIEISGLSSHERVSA